MTHYKDLRELYMNETEGGTDTKNKMFFLSDDVYKGMLIDLYDRKQITKEDLMYHYNNVTFIKLFGIGLAVYGDKSLKNKMMIHTYIDVGEIE